MWNMHNFVCFYPDIWNLMLTLLWKYKIVSFYELWSIFVCVGSLSLKSLAPDHCGPDPTMNIGLFNIRKLSCKLTDMVLLICPLVLELKHRWSEVFLHQCKLEKLLYDLYRVGVTLDCTKRIIKFVREYLNGTFSATFSNINILNDRTF